MMTAPTALPALPETAAPAPADGALPLDALAQFTREALTHRILSADEERELARRWRESGHTDTAARDALVTHNLRLVYDMAYRYARHATTMERLDLVQEGTLGLMHAIDKFDERSGNKLSTYATAWIRQAIQRAVGDRDPLIAVPAHVREALARERRGEPAPATRTTWGRSGRRQVDRESNAELVEAARRVASVGSLDAEIAPGSESGVTFADTVPAQGEEEASEAAQEEARRLRVREALASAHLTRRERMVVAYHYGIEPHPAAVSRPATLAEIAEMLDISRERARQIEAAALAKLRVWLAPEAAPAASCGGGGAPTAKGASVAA